MAKIQILLLLLCNILELSNRMGGKTFLYFCFPFPSLDTRQKMEIVKLEMQKGGMHTAFLGVTVKVSDCIWA